MKLLKPVSCLRETGGGNVKTQTALGDALFVWSSDRGSTPLGSTQTRGYELVFYENVFALVLQMPRRI